MLQLSHPSHKEDEVGELSAKDDTEALNIRD